MPGGHVRLQQDGTPTSLYMQDQQTFSPHYIPGNISNHPSLVHQPSPSFGLPRHDKPPGMPLDNRKTSQTPEPKGPSIVTVVDRPPPHSIPPHMSSPHGNDQRGTDSPSVGAVFPGQRQIYPSSGLPQQQHPSSQAISNMYAELESRSYNHSPSFIYDSRAISVAAAAAAAMEQERERPKGTVSPMDAAYRLRSSPLPLSSEGLQGDSLLHLLQVWKNSFLFPKVW